MNCYCSSFLDYTINYLNSWRINGKQVTEEDIISVKVGCDIVTWECFKESVKDITWSTYNNNKLIVSNIEIYGKSFIMFLDYDQEYCAYSWNSIYIPDNIEPNKEIKHVNVSKTDHLQ